MSASNLGCHQSLLLCSAAAWMLLRHRAACCFCFSVQHSACAAALDALDALVALGALVALPVYMCVCVCVCVCVVLCPSASHPTLLLSGLKDTGSHVVQRAALLVFYVDIVVQRFQEPAQPTWPYQPRALQGQQIGRRSTDPPDTSARLLPRGQCAEEVRSCGWGGSLTRCMSSSCGPPTLACPSPAQEGKIARVESVRPSRGGCSAR